MSVTPSEFLKTGEIITAPTLDSVSPVSSDVEKSDVVTSQPTVTSEATSLQTETVYGSINLVTRLRDTVLVFTTSPSSSSTAHSPGDIS